MDVQVITGNKGEKLTSLQEENLKVFNHVQGKIAERNKRLCESFKISKPELIDVGRAGLSIQSFREAAYAAHQRMGLQEATAELSFGQLLRAGVENTFNGIYQAVPVTYNAVVRETSSNKRQEFYAPLERIGFPKRVGHQGSFPETKFKGVDKELVNEKFGYILAIERELLDDDMTGQIAEQARQFGENARIYEEAYVWARIANSAQSLDGEALSVSETYSTVYADAVAGGIHGSGKGVNSLPTASSARLGQSSIQNGMILAWNMLDSSGRRMMVDPKVLAVSPQDMFQAKVLINSAQNPSKSSTATADDGKVGGIGSINPIQGLASIVVSRFIPAYGAFLVDAGKGFAFQRRDPTEIVQENPTSGPAFSQEVFRYKCRARWQADFIDPKFFINLNPTFAAS